MLRPWNHICKSRSAGSSAKTGTSLVGRLLSSRNGRSASRRRAGNRTVVTSATEALETRQLLAATPIAGLSDEFDDAATTAQWQRVNEVEGWNADQLNVYDIDATQPGRMVQQPNTAVWYQNYRGPMAFQTVTGDFSFTTQVHITDRDDVGGSDANDVPGDSLYSLAGAMLRTPRDITDPAAEWAPGSMADDGTNNGENYIFLSAGYGAGNSDEFALEIKTTRNSDSQLELTTLGPDTSTVNIQLSRIGDSVIALYQLPGQEWQVHRRYSRPDMPETIQVGLVTYTDWEKASDFDPFTQNSTVLVPGIAGDPTPGEAFNPDLTAGFEYARYALPDVPEALVGADLTDPAAVSDAELLSFLGDNTNIIDEGTGGGGGGETQPTAVPIPGLSDEFNDAASITDWLRLNETEGWNADQLQTFDIDQTQDGHLTMVPHTTVWFENYRGPLAYKTVTGDFAFTTLVNINDRDDIGGSDADSVPGDGDFSLGGVMIRTPRDMTDALNEWTPGSMADDGTNNGENFVFLSLGYGNAAYANGENQFNLEVKTTRNSSSELELTTLGPDASIAELQIARIGTDVFTLYRLPGEEWQVHRRFSRPDMPETLQVGMVTYTDWEKANDFDPFYQNSNALTPDGFDPTPGQAFNPDLVAGFDYARYVSLSVPESLSGLDLLNDATDEQLLSFLGTSANLIEEIVEENSAPTISEIADQAVLVGENQLIVDLGASDVDGDSLSFEVVVSGSLASEIMAEHDLHEANGVSDYALNWGGQSEKWVSGNNGWYFLLPDGSLNEWGGSFESSTQLAAFSVDVYNDPQILLTSTTPEISTEVVDGQLVITSGNETGLVEIEVTVSDGEESVSTTFNLEVTNTAPEVVIADQAATSGVPLEVALLAVDADGQALYYTVEVVGDELSVLDNEHGFWSGGNYYDNYLGQNERWIRDASNQWFYLLPDGELHRWEGSFDASPLIASLASEVYDDPSLLTDPQPVPVAASIVDGVLIITPAEGYVGEVQIRITDSDGFAETSTTFQVNVVADCDDEFGSADDVFADWDMLEV
ncbi:MAG: hypothetical protein O2983_11865 [Planctomycetota bacterium]|nr:hypothetical protein [Planctomycetota bacterium]